MTITALTEVRARPGEGPAMLRGWLELLSQYSPSLHARRFALVFQAIDDPDHLLYLAKWDSRAAFDARAAEIGSRGWVRERATPVVRFLEVRHTVEKVLASVHVAHLSWLRVPEAARDAAWAYLREEATIGFADPGFATRVLYADARAPDDVLVYRGWSSPAGLVAYRTARWPTIVAELVRLGVTGAYFSGYTRLALYGPPQPDAEVRP